jgi:cobyrinic acid a,c-diamide synthase
MNTVDISRIVVAGTTSGVGKTTISMGIMYSLRKRGLKVQPFKVGPDFIDPSYHTLVTGRQSRNLDMWMMGKKGFLDCFVNASYGADIAVIEGVMGLYDGVSGRSDFASTAEAARVLDAPVVLIIDTEKAARSVAAVALGFLKFDKRLKILGVILNNIASDKHARFITDAFKSKLKVPIIGIVRRNKKFKMEERHLGLIPAPELDEKNKRAILRSAKLVSEQIYLNLIDDALKQIPQIKITPDRVGKGHLRIAIAIDKSFNFYYIDNLEALRKQNVELVLFSPVTDFQLPDNISGIIIGGGFPEIMADKLEHNQSMIKSVLKAAVDGIPIYSECGGLMYLTKSIKEYGKGQWKKRKMVGLIDADTSMNARLTLNYTEAHSEGSFFGHISRLRGHEFHYSEIENIASDSKFAHTLKRGKGITNKEDGFIVYNSLASYMHLHFADNRLPERLVESCQKYLRR